MSITDIKKIEGGYIVYTDRVLFDREITAIKAELTAIAAERIGYLFFRVKGARV